MKMENIDKNVFISKLKAINLYGDSIIYYYFALILPIRYFSLISHYCISFLILLLISLIIISLISFSRYPFFIIPDLSLPSSVFLHPIITKTWLRAYIFSLSLIAKALDQGLYLSCYLDLSFTCDKSNYLLDKKKLSL